MQEKRWRKKFFSRENLNFAFQRMSADILDFYF